MELAQLKEKLLIAFQGIERINLKDKFKDLEGIREKEIGFTTTTDAALPDLAIETQPVIEKFNADFRGKLRQIGRSRIRGMISKESRQDTELLIQATLDDIETKTETYRRYTMQRRQYGLVTPIAFCELKDLPDRLGVGTLGYYTSASWTVRFQQLHMEHANIGLLEAIGVRESDFMFWWTGSKELKRDGEETSIWKDVKSLALRLVHILDRTEKSDPQYGTLAMVRLSDTSSQMKIEDIVGRMRRITITMIRLLRIRRNGSNQILPLFELLVPVCYAITSVIHFSTEKWPAIGSKAVSMLLLCAVTLGNIQEEIMDQLHAREDVKRHEASDNAPQSRQPSQIDHHQDPIVTMHETRDISELHAEAVRDLRSLGLDELDVDFSRKESYPESGSFSEVWKVPAKSGEAMYAVKFLKFKSPNDPRRVKNRLLREAAYWKKLNGEHINVLLGMFVHPAREYLPGLVSKLCPYTLASYTRDRTIPGDELLRYLHDVACGLSAMHLHKEKLAHGDLRPENVLLTPGRFGNGFMAVLSDFGVSYHAEDISGYDMTSMQSTNDVYLAPELFPTLDGDDKRRVSIPGDIYAFGCTFLRVFCKRKPFYYTSSAKIPQHKQDGDFPALVNDIEEPYWTILTRVWDAKPHKRPTAQDLVSQMHKFSIQL